MQRSLVPALLAVLGAACAEPIVPDPACSTETLLESTFFLPLGLTDLPLDPVFFGLEGSLGLASGEGAPLFTTAMTLSVDRPAATTLRRATPAQLLQPDTAYRFDFGRDGFHLFRTGLATDDTPPAPPTVEVSAPLVGCPATRLVRFGSDEPLVFLRPVDGDGVVDRERLLDVFRPGARDLAVVFPDRVVRAAALAVDFAGNESAPSEPFEVDTRAPGCASLGGAGGWALLLLVNRRVRRRRATETAARAAGSARSRGRG